MEDLQNIKTLPLSEIAQIIGLSWKRPNDAALPYLMAMHRLNSISDRYGMEDGAMIVAYFLDLASAYRGETARIVKKELVRRLQGGK